MNITTQRIHGGRRFRVTARQGNIRSVAVSANKKTAFKRAVAGAWKMIH